MIELLLAAVLVGQEVTLTDTSEGNPYAMQWRVNNTVVKTCTGILSHAPSPLCPYHWTPTQPGTVTIRLTAYCLHETKLGNPYVATASVQIEVTTGESYIFADSFEGGVSEPKPGDDDGD